MWVHSLKKKKKMEKNIYTHTYSHIHNSPYHIRLFTWCSQSLSMVRNHCTVFYIKLQSFLSQVFTKYLMCPGITRGIRDIVTNKSLSLRIRGRRKPHKSDKQYHLIRIQTFSKSITLFKDVFFA